MQIGRRASGIKISQSKRTLAVRRGRETAIFKGKPKNRRLCAGQGADRQETGKNHQPYQRRQE